MKIGFIGLGRMGQGMANRILEAGHELIVFDKIEAHTDDIGKSGAQVATSLAELTKNREVVISMLPHDKALEGLVFSQDGLANLLEKDCIHMPMGTHGVDIIKRINKKHLDNNQVLVAGHVLGRPDMAATGQLTLVPAGPPTAIQKLSPIFDVLGKKMFIAGSDPESATAVKIANNFVLGSAIEVIGESMSLVRKYGVDPDLFYQVLIEGLFGCPAYEVYGKIIAEEDYDSVGASVQIGLKDANLALQAGESVGVPLPSCNVMRDRLLESVSNGDEEKDWAVMARAQAKASGLEK
ncbi:MAG: hypothetical protein CBC38_05175 [Gammaproteobacteria bacterium TMED78]|nr:MAG: hypothetical protein CBC38_05175 [Gammaproteobacteria bacterium TMED78]|tara:strand:+ start:9850 stop:10734 length:885 start_codon:yes stop_codon:yes gene_type:complete